VTRLPCIARRPPALQRNEIVNGEDKDAMKRLPPERRQQLIKDHLRHLVSDWTCRYGEWNRQKLLTELESALKARRRAKVAS
jgi:hypothetical protein